MVRLPRPRAHLDGRLARPRAAGEVPAALLRGRRRVGRRCIVATEPTVPPRVREQPCAIELTGVEERPPRADQVLQRGQASAR